MLAGWRYTRIQGGGFPWAGSVAPAGGCSCLDTSTSGIWSGEIGDLPGICGPRCIIHVAGIGTASGPGPLFFRSPRRPTGCNRLHHLTYTWFETCRRRHTAAKEPNAPMMHHARFELEARGLSGVTPAPVPCHVHVHDFPRVRAACEVDGSQKKKKNKTTYKRKPACCVVTGRGVPSHES